MLLRKNHVILVGGGVGGDRKIHEKFHGEMCSGDGGHDRDRMWEDMHAAQPSLGCTAEITNIS